MRAASAALVLVLAGCGGSHAVDEDPGAPVPTYAGDLSGADGAERALECDGAVRVSGQGDLTDGLEEVAETPGLAWDGWLEDEGGQLVPREGYVVEGGAGDRVLVSFDVAGRTRAAAVVRDGQTDYRGDDGWGVESWAGCDPAEWPAETTDDLDIVVWTDRTGARVPTSSVTSFPGPEHCDWDRSTWLWLGVDGADGEFIGSPLRSLQDHLQTTWSPDTALPSDARDTGWQHDGRELWLAVDRSAAYLVGDDGDTQRWPATTQRLGCA